MRSFTLFLCAAAMLATSACQQHLTPPAGNGSVPVAGDSLVDQDELAGIELTVTRRLVDAELAYQAAAQLALQGIKTGFIKGKSAQAVRDINRDALTALSSAKAAKDVASRALEVGRLGGLTAALTRIASTGEAK